MWGREHFQQADKYMAGQDCQSEECGQDGQECLEIQLQESEVPHLGLKSPRHQYMLDISKFETSYAEKALEVLVDNKLTMSG